MKPARACGTQSTMSDASSQRQVVGGGRDGIHAGVLEHGHGSGQVRGRCHHHEPFLAQQRAQRPHFVDGVPGLGFEDHAVRRGAQAGAGCGHCLCLAGSHVGRHLLTGPTAIQVAVAAAECLRPTGPGMPRATHEWVPGAAFAASSPSTTTQCGAGEPSGRVDTRLSRLGQQRGIARFQRTNQSPGHRPEGKQRHERETRGEQGLGGSLFLGETQKDQSQAHDGKQQGIRLHQGRQQFLEGEHGSILYRDSSTNSQPVRGNPVARRLRRELGLFRYPVLPAYHRRGRAGLSATFRASLAPAESVFPT